MVYFLNNRNTVDVCMLTCSRSLRFLVNLSPLSTYVRVTFHTLMQYLNAFRENFSKLTESNKWCVQQRQRTRAYLCRLVLIIKLSRYHMLFCMLFFSWTRDASNRSYGAWFLYGTCQFGPSLPLWEVQQKHCFNRSNVDIQISHLGVWWLEVGKRRESEALPVKG